MMQRHTLSLIVFYACMLLVPETAAEQSNKDELHDAYLSRAKRYLPYRRLLSSDKSIYDHIDWGKPEDRVFTKKVKLDERHYIGYGQCPHRWPIHYRRHVLGAAELQLIVQAYAEMFGMSCNSNFVNNLRGLFEKGYARLEIDHSVDFSFHTILFIKTHLSFQDYDDLELLLEFAAFTQTYVSWFKFPVNPLDPIGKPITDNCFIQIVARLHVLDLIISVSRRHKDRIAYNMGVKLKGVLNAMRLEYSMIKGYDDPEIEKRGVIAKQCLVVTMALMEFFFKKSDMGLKRNCCHAAFKEFYTPQKEKAYQEEAKKYGRLQ